jgi:hypothetical protein
MFSGAGVRIEWRGHAADGAHLPAGALAVSLEPNTAVQFMPRALALARVYEGVHIAVFCNRIQRLAPASAMQAPLLAHVLVHEITHMLQGIDRHSERGIMKAIWNGLDYATMITTPLPFTTVDIELIRRGLTARAHEGTLIAADSVSLAPIN